MLMDEHEICLNYKQAKNKNAQIEILADLNSVKPSEITTILARNNMISGITSKMIKPNGFTGTVAQKPSCTKWTKEMEVALLKDWEKGLSLLDLAEKFGVTKSSIQNKLSRIKPGKSNTKKSVPKTNLVQKDEPESQNKLIPSAYAVPKVEQPISKADMAGYMLCLRAVLENAVKEIGAIHLCQTDYNTAKIIVTGNIGASVICSISANLKKEDFINDQS